MIWGMSWSCSFFLEAWRSQHLVFVPAMGP